MPSKTKKQQSCFGMIHSANKNHKRLKGKAGKAQRTMTDKQIKHFTKLEENALMYENYINSNSKQPICAIDFSVTAFDGVSINGIDSLDTNLDTIVSGYCQVKYNLYRDKYYSRSFYYVIYEFTPEAYEEFKKYVKELTKTDFDEFEFSKNRLVKLLKYEFPKESRPMVNYIEYGKLPEGITDDDIDDLFS
jgi:hypothetical protein